MGRILGKHFRGRIFREESQSVWFCVLKQGGYAVHFSERISGHLSDFWSFVCKTGEMLPIFRWELLGSGVCCSFECQTGQNAAHFL